jgi:hypothetical protein
VGGLWRPSPSSTAITKPRHFITVPTATFYASTTTVRCSRRLRHSSDALDRQGDAGCDLAEVLGRAGRIDDAVAALDQALERYERKGNPGDGAAGAAAP